MKTSEGMPMTSDPLALHRIDSTQLDHGDCVKKSGDSIEINFAGEEPDEEFHASVNELKQQGQAAFVIAMMIIALAVIAFFSTVRL